MARYEYRCRSCGDTFELSRPMSEASAPAICPAGHDDTVKLISAVAVNVGGRTGDATRANKSAAAPGNAGGCCGGGCCG